MSKMVWECPRLVQLGSNRAYGKDPEGCYGGGTAGSASCPWFGGSPDACGPGGTAMGGNCSSGTQAS